MKKPDVISGNDSASYFKLYFNVLKYKELTQNPNFKKLFNPTTFVVLLWDSHDRVIRDYNDPHQLIKYFSSLRLSKPQMLYLLQNLLLTFNKNLIPGLKRPENDVQLNLCLDFISIKCDKLTALLDTHIFDQCFLFDFTLIERILETKPRACEKLTLLITIQTDFKQYDTTRGQAKQTYFNYLCELGILKFGKIAEYEKNNPQDPFTDPLPPRARFKSPDDIRKYISEKINSIDPNLKWEYTFLSHHDFTLFIFVFSGYFYSGNIDPEFKLILQPHCKTRHCPVLYDIYCHFSPTPLKKTMLSSPFSKNSPFLKINPLPRFTIQSPAPANIKSQ